MMINLILPIGGPRGRALMMETVELCKGLKGVKLAGVIADIPMQSKKRRYTWYPQFKEYPNLIKAESKALGLPIYEGWVSDQYKVDTRGLSAFHRWIYFEVLRLEKPCLGDEKLLFLMAGQGQKFMRRTLSMSKYWFFNTHPVAFGTEWNHRNPFRGPVPWERMLLSDVKCAQIVAHRININYDCGIEVLRAGPIKLAEYNGPLPYVVSRKGKKRIVRPHELGEFVHEMHLRACKYTREIARKILVSQVLKAIQSGQHCTEDLLDRLFPNSNNHKPTFPSNNEVAEGLNQKCG